MASSSKFQKAALQNRSYNTPPSPSLPPSTPSKMPDVNTLKDQGNKAFAAKDYDKAIDLFTQAIALDPRNHVLYSNRSAAKAGKKLWPEALSDAEECIKANPSWSKGYARKGAALHGAKRYDEAIAAYEEGLKLEDSPALRKGLQDVKDAKASGSDPMGIRNMFSDPNLFAKLAANPRTQKHLADPAFVKKLQLLQSSPELAKDPFGQDPRMIDVLGVLMGIDMRGFEREEGSSELPPEVSAAQATPSSPTPPPRANPAPSTSQPKPTPAPEPPKGEDVEMEDVDEDEAKAKREAEAAKKLGGEAYKQRNFAEAITQFEKAWQQWPKDVTFLTNLGAAHFEAGDYDKAIEVCEKAVDEGRSLRADYKLIAKAYGRIGSAYQKKSDLANAIKFFNKSLTEHRTPDVLNKLRDAEKQKAELDRLAYIDPAKSAVAREEGNAQFKAGDFAAAVKSYTESIKRDPKDARGYNNRAAAYMKLAAFPEALKDADEAIDVDPSFIKAYIRKSSILLGMREHTKALDAIQLAEEKDTEGKHRQEIAQQEAKVQQAIWQQRGSETNEQTFERAMRDPEVD
ncbi:hypothetical protein AX16_000235 [Volvariella volvacea WC 439]|nr:hypothetical protein AX16_000235 [Volvariella volvacea WC 439]